MLKREIAVYGVATLLGALTVGCADHSSPAEPDMSSHQPSASVRSPLQPMPESPGPSNASQRLARLIPQFGGAFISDGVLNVYLTDLSAADQARSVVRQELDMHGRPGLPVRFVRGTHSYRQLETWRIALLPLFSTDGVVSLGIDERGNSVGFGVETDAARVAIEAALDRFGVPPEAVIFEHWTIPVVTAQLTDRVRPVMGGLQLFINQGSSYFGQCSFGANVTYNNARYFVTSSHCADRAGNGNTGQYVYQSSSSGSGSVGRVSVNPAFREGIYGCPPGERCRYSDATLVGLYDSVDWDLRAIAQPSGPVFLPGTSGSITFDPANPIRIIGTLTDVFVGDVVTKVGKVTGWTGGQVLNTYETLRGPDGLTRIGSVVVTGGAQEGDSGAPTLFNGSSGYVLAGIQWGAATSNGQPVFLYSDWRDVDYELAAYGLDPISPPSSTDPCEPEPGQITCS